MQVNEKKVKEVAPNLVNKALNQFEAFKDTTEDIIDESGEDFCVKLGSIANYDQGDKDIDALNNLGDLVDGVDKEIEETDEEWLNESVDEATGMISDALNETPEAKKENINFFYMTEEGSNELNACMGKEAFAKKFGNGKSKKSKK